MEQSERDWQFFAQALTNIIVTNNLSISIEELLEAGYFQDELL